MTADKTERADTVAANVRPRATPKPAQGTGSPAGRPSPANAVAGNRQGAAVVVLTSACLALGLFLRLHAFRFPAAFLFDEHHFVENARNYLDHRADWNDHPPLGKLIIAVAIRWLGDNPAAWRLPSLVSGLFTVIFGGWASARLFRDRAGGWITAALLASDGFFISYSRVGLLDGHLAAASVAALWLTTWPWTTTTAILAGLLTGLATSIKFSGGAVVIPFALAAVTCGRPWKQSLWRAALAALLAIVLYVALFAWGLHLAGHAAGPEQAISETARLLRQHAGATEMKNPWVSGWPTWVLPLRPLVMGYVEQRGAYRVLSSLGNLAIWWAAVPLAFAVSGTILWRGLRTTLAPAKQDERVEPHTGNAPTCAPSVFVRDHGRSSLLALAGAAGFLAPWVLTHRDSYVYHFLPSYAALVVLLGGYAGWVWKRKPRLVLGWLATVLVVAAIYAPVWSFIPISARGFRSRLFLESWR